MAEFINRDTFLEQKREWYCDKCDRRKNSKGKTVYEIGEAPCRACDIGTMLDAVEDYPTADVRPVVRAAWQSWDQDKPPCKWYSCDYCGFHALSKSNFCPNCGADMREES